jgi:putative endonuclease
MRTAELGRRGEDAAAAFVERSGMTIVERNWSCPAGEVDLVALDGTTLVFIEVKTRRSESAGTPEEAVSSAKQRKYGRIAQTYVAYAGLDSPDLRFDVIAIRVIAPDRALLRHHTGAFTL